MNAQEPAAPRERIYRHTLATRITHWINVLCFSVLLLSGLQILNAHPRLYWGEAGANTDPAFISFYAVEDESGALRGFTKIGALRFETTGFLGASRVDGEMTARGAPSWLTLPTYRDLAAGRRWHFFFAWLFVINGLVYLGFGVANGHFRRDLKPSKDELRPRNLWADIKKHARLHVPRGQESKRYNTLQKLAYLATIFIALPVMVLTGLTMSPGMNATLPFLLDIFGGRQSARTLHFLSAGALMLFVFVHVFEVFLAGAWNEIRSMITGWYEVKPEKKS